MHHLHVSARVAAYDQRTGLDERVDDFGLACVLGDRTHDLVGHDAVADARLDAQNAVDRNAELLVDEPLIEQLRRGRYDPYLEAVFLQIGQQLLHFGIELARELVLVADPAGVTQFVGRQSGEEVDAPLRVGDGHVIACGQFFADFPFFFRQLVLTVLVVRYGEVVHRFLAQVVGRLADQRAVAVEYGDLPLLHGERRVQKRFDSPVRLVRPAGYAAVSLAESRGLAEQQRDDGRCDFSEKVGSFHE